MSTTHGHREQSDWYRLWPRKLTTVPMPPVRPPRAPFNRIAPTFAGFGSKCQLCSKRGRTNKPGLKINAVGPFAICEDCVAELERVFT